VAPPGTCVAHVGQRGSANTASQGWHGQVREL